MGVVKIGASDSGTNSAGVQLTSDASADTYNSSYTTLRSAGTFPAMNLLHLQFRVVTGTGRIFVVALYHGAGNTLFAEIPVRINTTSNEEQLASLHVNVPADVVIKARCKDSVGSGAMMVAVQGQEDVAQVTTGAPSADLLTLSAGPAIEVALDTGGTLGTDVSATLATLAADYNCFYVRLRDTSSGGAADGLWQLKDDGTVFATRFYKRLTNADPNVFWYGPIYHSAANGSVITVEGRSSSATINDMNFSLLGLNVPTPSTSGGATKLVNGGLIG